MKARDDMDDGLPLSARLKLAVMGGALPHSGSASSSTRRGTKTAWLAGLGWRVLPIPQFWAARQMWHDPRTGEGNPAYIDFAHPREWVVIPPEGHALAARKIVGRVCAIRWAYEQATGRDLTA